MDVSLRVNRLFAITIPSLMAIMNLSSVAVLWLGAYRVDAGEMEIGNLTAFLHLDGKWFNERESVRYDGEQGESGRALVLSEAVEVNSVMNVESGGPAKVFAMQDKHSLTSENAGLDILFEEDGKSYVLVDNPRRFNVVVNKEYGPHELELFLRAPGVEVFAVSFVTGVIPELVSAN